MHDHGHHHGHDHAHHGHLQHNHIHEHTDIKPLRISIILTVTVFVAQVIGGFISGSLALLSDAGHVLVDLASLLIAFIFVTICLALVIALLFSWRVADQLQIDQQKTTRYQALGFLTGLVSVGFVMWWYGYLIDFNTESLFSSQAFLQEQFLTLQHMDHRIFLVGFAYAALLHFFIEDVSLIIVGCMMEFSIVGWLILAGIISLCIKNRQNYYPFCFGVYAMHAVWLLVQALF